ncbi:DUF3137 domain-containing protein [uncultured Campylobacter sp.]|uniref:DUF3137 domain-containing protein n=1 Tax=uncultured Campylobacter sp. TaxID=218934 RepID=UPI002630DD4A|nr:DUF3137 domain-containing protein [uncultured Campylobacter sp.]
MTANELEKLRLGILDEAEQRKGTAFSIIVLAVLASALWLFFNFRDQEAAVGLCWIIVIFSCGSISFRVVNKDANIVRVFIFCTLLWMLAKGVEMCENDTLRFVITLVTICLSLFNIADAVLERIKYNRSKKFVRAFKHQYIAPYIASLGCRYEISGSFRPAYLRTSGLFVDGISYFDCEDKISGVYDGVFFSFADVCVTHTDERRSSRGIFFYAEFKKRINSTTVILPLLSAKPTLGGLKKIAMDDSEFSSAFSVYSADAVSAMYALTPAFMRRLLRFRSGAGGPISLSFSGRNVYIFIRTGYDSFEPSVDRSVFGFDPAASIKHELLFFLSIVKSLKLNENIWQD